jgi:hypothetical protein
MRWCWYVIALCAAAGGCGRIGFDAVNADSGSAVDTGPPSAKLAVIELWETAGHPVPSSLTPGFDPDVTDYAVAVGLTLQRVQFSARPIHPGTTFTINGIAAAPDELSAPLALALGANPITVIATATTGETETYIVEVTRAAQLAQTTYAKSSNSQSNDQFGFSIKLDGDTLAVGAYLEDGGASGVNGDQNNDGAPNSGAVYVFVRSGDTWVQQAYLKASNTETNDRFGNSLALSGDTLAVGAYTEASSAVGVGGNQADNSASNSGAVYVFTRSGGVWSQQAYLKASNTDANDFFGSSLALSGDSLAVGAYPEDSSAIGVGGNQSDNTGTDSGAVYVFTRTGTTWSQQAYLKASNSQIADRFGWSVALSGDTLAVGAYWEDSSATGVGGNQADNSASNSGAVYVFARSGGVWSQQSYLKASNTEVDDWFGFTLALEGDLLAVGARNEDSAATGVGGNQGDNSAMDSGAVYLFLRGPGAWSQVAYLKASNTGATDYFSAALALSGDLLAVGAYQEDSNAVGVGGTQGDESADASGAVYMFRRDSGFWAQHAYLKASNTGTGDAFGYSVALSGNALAIGAPSEDSAATGLGGDQSSNVVLGSGAVYLFE